MSDKIMYLVFSNAVDGKDEEFNEWYNTVHVPDVLSTPGLLSAQRFSVVDTERTRATGGPSHRYLAIYEMEGDPDVVMAKTREAVQSGKMVMSDLLAKGSVTMSFWEPIGPKVEA